MQIDSGERCDRCRGQMQGAERVAAVGVQRSRADGKAHTASPQQDTNYTITGTPQQDTGFATTFGGLPRLAEQASQ